MLIIFKAEIEETI